MRINAIIVVALAVAVASLVDASGSPKTEKKTPQKSTPPPSRSPSQSPRGSSENLLPSDSSFPSFDGSFPSVGSGSGLVSSSGGLTGLGFTPEQAQKLRKTGQAENAKLTMEFGDEEASPDAIFNMLAGGPSSSGKGSSGTLRSSNSGSFSTSGELTAQGFSKDQRKALKKVGPDAKAIAKANKEFAGLNQNDAFKAAMESFQNQNPDDYKNIKTDVQKLDTAPMQGAIGGGARSNEPGSSHNLPSSSGDLVPAGPLTNAKPRSSGSSDTLRGRVTADGLTSSDRLMRAPVFEAPRERQQPAGLTVDQSKKLEADFERCKNTLNEPSGAAIWFAPGRADSWLRLLQSLKGQKEAKKTVIRLILEEARRNCEDYFMHQILYNGHDNEAFPIYLEDEDEKGRMGVKLNKVEKKMQAPKTVSKQSSKTVTKQ